MLALGGLFLSPALAQPPVDYGSPQFVITGYAYAHISTDATTVVKSAPGLLHTICVNTPVATETITIYDNTAASGTKIGVATLYASTNPCFLYDVYFTTGLTIVTATAAGDITVSYY
jgi:hypothetical protein